MQINRNKMKTGDQWQKRKGEKEKRKKELRWNASQVELVTLGPGEVEESWLIERAPIGVYTVQEPGVWRAERKWRRKERERKKVNSEEKEKRRKETDEPTVE